MRVWVGGGRWQGGGGSEGVGGWGEVAGRGGGIVRKRGKGLGVVVERKAYEHNAAINR